MVTNLQEIRKEAIKRSKMAIDSVRKQNLSRKEVRKIALESARNTIDLMNQIDNGEEEMTDGQKDLLAQKVVLVAMKSF